MQSHHNLTERRFVDETFQSCEMEAEERFNHPAWLVLGFASLVDFWAHAELRTDNFKRHSQAQEADSLLSCDYRVVLNQDRSADRFRRDTLQQFELLPNDFSQPLHDSWSCSSNSVGKSMLMP